jgi:hypothetical protein
MVDGWLEIGFGATADGYDGSDAADASGGREHSEVREEAL